MSNVILLKDLEAIIQKLNVVAPPNSDLPFLEKHGEKPRKAFQQAILIDRGDDAKSRRGFIWLRLWSYDSLMQAEEGIAQNQSMVNIALRPGSLTGRAGVFLPTLHATELD